MMKATTPEPMMNIMPPMVGVPAFPACQEGPSFRISCPAWSLRSSAMTNFPSTRVSTKLSPQASSSVTIIVFPLPRPDPPGGLSHLRR